MTMPIPLIEANSASRLLTGAWTQLNRTISSDQSRPPALLVVFPPSWNNRYQVLLYGLAASHGFKVVGISDTADLEAISWPGPIVFHAHWFATAFRDCEHERDAANRLQRLKRDVERFRSRTGARLLWTAHNVFPHGNRFPLTNLKLRQWVFQEFDAVHVMHDDHLPILTRTFQRQPRRSFTVPHMLYDGSHPDVVSKSEAKAHYGIPENSIVFAYFGSIQAYKNLTRVVECALELDGCLDRPVYVLIAGGQGEPAAVQELQQRWLLHPRVRLAIRTVPDYEIQFVHHAADAMVLPYDQTLNSGAAFMAASFGLPFVMPRGPSAIPLQNLGAVQFDHAQPDGLKQAMVDTILRRQSMISPDIRERHLPRQVSRLFFNNLCSIIA